MPEDEKHYLRTFGKKDRPEKSESHHDDRSERRRWKNEQTEKLGKTAAAFKSTNTKDVPGKRMERYSLFSHQTLDGHDELI